jgi:hypothetical protein
MALDTGLSPGAASCDARKGGRAKKANARRGRARTPVLDMFITPVGGFETDAGKVGPGALRRTA